MIKFKRSRFLGIFLAALVSVISLCACTQGKTPEYFPDQSFRTSSPEEQGMDSEKLYRMLSYIRDDGKEIHSIQVIRNGYKVLDTSFFPYSNRNLHAVNSVTKSVTSALFGIALEEKKIKSIDDKVLSYFPERKVKNADDNKNSMTLKNLLMMTGGFDWLEDGSYDENDSWTKMRQSTDPIGYILDLSVTAKPGENFYYNTGGSHILSDVLQKSTGKKGANYAEEKIFRPMGIEEKSWNQDNTGVSIGGAGLFLKPEDMAKFGYLYLKNGKWKGKQLVPEWWVKESTSKKIDTPNGLAGSNGYGYQWWMNSFGGYSARGFGGQYIFVVPEYDLVVAFASGLSGFDFFLPENLVESFVMGSISEKESLPANKTSYDKLLEIQKELSEVPKASNPAKPSSFAKEISGKTYILDDKSEVTFDFEKDSECTISYKWENNDIDKYLVGLDDVWRISDNLKNGPIDGANSGAAKGEWVDEKQFTYSYRPLNDMGEIVYRIDFDGDAIAIDSVSMWGTWAQKGKLK